VLVAQARDGFVTSAMIPMLPSASIYAATSARDSTPAGATDSLTHPCDQLLSHVAVEQTAILHEWQGGGLRKR